MERVVVTGIGIVSPLGMGLEHNWQQLMAGRSGISLIDAFDVSEQKTKIAGLVRAFDAEGIFGRKEARRLDRFAQFGLAAAEQALHDSELQLANWIASGWPSMWAQALAACKPCRKMKRSSGSADRGGSAHCLCP